MKKTHRLIAMALAITMQSPAHLVARPAVPWSVRDRVTIEYCAMSFENAGVRLSGTLYAPRGAHNLPVVIAFHGVGAPSRDLPLYDHLKTVLPPLGIAVLVLDRRGTGRSTGDEARKTDLDILASDGVAAFRMLAIDTAEIV